MAAAKTGWVRRPLPTWRSCPGVGVRLRIDFIPGPGERVASRVTPRKRLVGSLRSRQASGEVYELVQQRGQLAVTAFLQGEALVVEVGEQRQ
jgi:hypothetical protein